MGLFDTNLDGLNGHTSAALPGVDGEEEAHDSSHEEEEEEDDEWDKRMRARRLAVRSLWSYDIALVS